MSTVAVTRLIDAPAADVWRVLTEVPERADRLSGVQAVEPLTAGPVRPGSAWRETRSEPDGGGLAEEFLVVEAVAPRRLVLTSRGQGVDYRSTYTLTPVDSRRHPGCTAVTVVQEAVPATARGRLLALLFGGLAAQAGEGAIRADLDDLARAAERIAGPAAA